MTGTMKMVSPVAVHRPVTKVVAMVDQTLELLDNEPLVEVILSIGHW